MKPEDLDRGIALRAELQRLDRAIDAIDRRCDSPIATLRIEAVAMEGAIEVPFALDDARRFLTDQRKQLQRDGRVIGLTIEDRVNERGPLGEVTELATITG